VSARPVDLPMFRREARLWMEAEGEHSYLGLVAAFRRDVDQRLAARAAPIAARHATRRLADAELFFVTKEMTELSIAASASLPPFSLLPEDLPTPTGLIFFETPFFRGASTALSAAVWSRWDGPTASGEYVRDGIWVDWYTDAQRVAGDWERAGEDPEMVRLARTGPRLGYSGDTTVSFSADPAAVARYGMVMPFTPDPDGDPARGELGRCMATLKTAWLLMMQPISSVVEATLDRPSRRRLQRVDEPPAPVRVISLRRTTSTATGSDGRDYHHQWIVRGHWRQQWYPARQVHRPVWIAPHVKGPEGAPMLGGEKVYAWQR